MYEEFWEFLQQNNQEIFIDVEGKRDRILNFITEYNEKYDESIVIGSDGICPLSETVDKWGIELRIYFNDTTGLSSYWNSRKYRNQNYRSDEYNYRLDDNQLVRFLFDKGFRVGYN